jgi:hypothetical protein
MMRGYEAPAPGEFDVVEYIASAPTQNDAQVKTPPAGGPGGASTDSA